MKIPTGIQSYQSSSQSSFGPSGGSINLQSSSFGPSGGQTITQTAQIPANDGQVYSQTTYTENGNGGQAYTQSSQYSSDSSGSSAEFVPQNIIKINADKSAFRQQSYLPPNGCSNC